MKELLLALEKRRKCEVAQATVIRMAKRCLIRAASHVEPDTMSMVSIILLSHANVLEDEYQQEVTKLCERALELAKRAGG